MENASLIGLSRQVALARELDVVANNVANAETNGFKRRASRFEEYLSPTASADAFPRADRRLSYVTERGTTLDLSGGALERTGNPLDVAVSGEAMLSAQSPRGERFTRNGSMSLDARGRLVTSDGFPVLTDRGPVTVAPEETDLKIAADGSVSSSQGPKGRLRLTSFRDAQALTNEGANLFSSPGPNNRPAGPEVRLESGVIEKSNVKPVLEIGRMIELNRAYASLASMLTRADELRRTAVNRLADVT